MMYLITTPQLQTVNNELFAIGEPPLASVSFGNISSIEYDVWIAGLVKKFEPYTAFPVSPSLSAIIADVEGSTVLPSEEAISVIASSSPVHDHDTEYSEITHTHDPNYSPIGHDHDIDYSSVGHDHNLTYSILGHTHTPAPHDHDLLYAPLSHVTDPHVDTILAPYTFTLEGNGSTGMWLTASTRSGIPSNLAPAIAPADVVLIASTYSNENNNSSFSLDFYVNGGATPAYTWDIVNARVGRKNHDETIMPPDLMLNRDDRLSLRVGALSSLPKDAFVILYFSLINDPTPGEFFLATI